MRWLIVSDASKTGQDTSNPRCPCEGYWARLLSTAMPKEKTRFDLHQTLTNQIINAIERVSAEDFCLPGHRSGMSSIQPRNALTKNAYRGINIVSLWWMLPRDREAPSWSFFDVSRGS